MNLVFATLPLLTGITVLAGIAGPSAAEPPKPGHAAIDRLPVSFEGLWLFEHSLDCRRPDSGRPTTELDAGEGTLPARQDGHRTRLFGQLQDTGAINLFFPHWYDGRRLLHRRYYVKQRVFKHPHNSVWVTADATITRVDTRSDDKYEIEIHSYRGLSAKELQTVCHGLVKSHQWVSANCKSLDLNQYKKKHKRPLFVKEENWGADFNKLPRRDLVEIRSLDMKRRLGAFACSRYVIEEVPHHHAVYLDLVIVFDLKNKRPLRLLVARGGYFLE